MENTIIIKTPVKEIIENFVTKEECYLCSTELGNEMKSDDVEKIVKICNQKSVYDFLFRKRLEGRVYEKKDAEWFLNWIAEGWQKQKWFVFFIRNNKEDIIAAIDIKSDNLESAEVGYWADEENPGVMTNAAIKLSEIAIKNGFRKLYALVLPENVKSIGVVKRAGFIFKEEVDKDDKHYLKFVKVLKELAPIGQTQDYGKSGSNN